jgi:ABC-type nickel/cobalt efflux system permease component RcnA
MTAGQGNAHIVAVPLAYTGTVREPRTPQQSQRREDGNKQQYVSHDDAASMEHGQLPVADRGSGKTQGIGRWVQHRVGHMSQHPLKPRETWAVHTHKHRCTHSHTRTRQHTHEHTHTYIHTHTHTHTARYRRRRRGKRSTMTTLRSEMQLNGYVNDVSHTKE